MNTKFVSVFLESPGGHPEDESRYRGLLLPATAVGSSRPGKARYCQNWQSSCRWLHFNGTMEILQQPGFKCTILHLISMANLISLHVKIGTKLNVE